MGHKYQYPLPEVGSQYTCICFANDQGKIRTIGKTLLEVEKTYVERIGPLRGWHISIKMVDILEGTRQELERYGYLCFDGKWVEHRLQWESNLTIGDYNEL